MIFYALKLIKAAGDVDKAGLQGAKHTTHILDSVFRCKSKI